MQGITACFEGRTGADAELRFGADGKPYVRFPIAVDEVRNGQPTGQIEWVCVTLFGDVAEALAERIVKGTQAYCGGRLHLARWDASGGEGQKMGLTMTAWTVQPMGQIGRRRPS